MLLTKNFISKTNKVYSIFASPYAIQGTTFSSHAYHSILSTGKRMKKPGCISPVNMRFMSVVNKEVNNPNLATESTNKEGKEGEKIKTVGAVDNNIQEKSSKILPQDDLDTKVMHQIEKYASEKLPKAIDERLAAKAEDDSKKAESDGHKSRSPRRFFNSRLLGMSVIFGSAATLLMMGVIGKQKQQEELKDGKSLEGEGKSLENNVNQSIFTRRISDFSRHVSEYFRGK